MPLVYFKNSSQTIPVHSTFCIGRNYKEHAAELQNPVPQKPLVFIKPLNTITYSGQSIILPKMSRDVHHEVEVVVVIGKSGKNILAADAPDFIAGYGIGIDVTARDIQQVAKEKSHPWTVAKGFDTFAPISSFVEASEIPDPGNLDFQLSINHKLRQQGNTRDMIFPISELIAYLSTIFSLSPGDLIFTGTPEGVGPLQEGDRVQAVLDEHLAELNMLVIKESGGI